MSTNKDSNDTALREAVATGVAVTAGSIAGKAVAAAAIAVGGVAGALAAPVLIGVALYHLGKSGDSCDSQK